MHFIYGKRKLFQNEKNASKTRFFISSYTEKLPVTCVLYILSIDLRTPDHFFIFNRTVFMICTIGRFRTASP